MIRVDDWSFFIKYNSCSLKAVMAMFRSLGKAVVPSLQQQARIAVCCRTYHKNVRFF